jgi:hypothetical protein
MSPILACLLSVRAPNEQPSEKSMYLAPDTNRATIQVTRVTVSNPFIGPLLAFGVHRSVFPAAFEPAYFGHDRKVVSERLC